MKYRRYGRTGLEVSVITLGAMRVTFKEDDCTAGEIARHEHNVVATMRVAMEQGINHIDTARGYLNSERLVGLGLKELGREKFHISTKIPIQPSKDEANRQIDEALEKMQIDRIDVLDLHGINTEEELKTATDPNGCIAAIQDAIADGRVGYAGCSTHAEAKLVTKIIETDLFDAISLHQWWTCHKNSDPIRLARARDIATLTLSTAEKGGVLYRPTRRLIEVCAPFSPLVLAHRWLIAHEKVNTISVGPANPEQLYPHLPAGDGPEDLTAEEQAALDRWTDAEIESLAGTRCTQCRQCLPCPQNVNIPEVLRHRNLVRTFDMIEFGKMRYNLLGHADDWFPGEQGDKCNGCGECLPRCPEQLKIPDLLKDAHEILTGESRARLWE